MKIVFTMGKLGLGLLGICLFDSQPVHAAPRDQSVELHAKARDRASLSKGKL